MLCSRSMNADQPAKEAPRGCRRAPPSALPERRLSHTPVPSHSGREFRGSHSLHLILFALRSLKMPFFTDHGAPPWPSSETGMRR